MLDCLQASEIRAAIAEKDAELDIVIHRSIDSTNSWSLQQCKVGKALPFACFAEEQTQGRGRRGKQWSMSAQSNIAMSLSWSFNLSQVPLNLLPLSVAMAIVETLESIGLKHVQIKWPNDVLVRGRKIAGVLIETQPVTSEETAVVIGAGLNFEMPGQEVMTVQDGVELFTEIADIKSAMLDQGLATDISRTNVAIELLNNIIKVVRGYKSSPGYHLEKYRLQYDYCKEKNVDIKLDDESVLSGIAKGVNDAAELLVIIDGKQHVFNSAEVSVRIN